MAELDSALNEWIDSVPGHRVYFGLSNLTGPLTASAS